MKESLVIYKAGAGSGKTFTLTVEYIALLLQSIKLPQNPKSFHELVKNRDYSIDPSQTLAVTFTNKATAEMKSRILETLYDLAYDIDGERVDTYLACISEKLSESGESSDKGVIAMKAKIALTYILHDYNKFRVETIDSFFQSILRNLAHELGLSPNLRVELGTDEVVSQAVEHLIARIQDDKVVKDWVLGYVRESLQEGERWNISTTLKQFAKCIFQEEYQTRTDEEKQLQNSSESIENFKKRLWEKKAINERELATLPDQALAFLYDEGFSCCVPYAEACQKSLEEARNLNFKMKKTLEKALDDPSSVLKKKYQNDPDLLEKANAFSEAFRTFLARYEEILFEITTSNLCLKYLTPLRLLNHIEKEINKINTENNQFNLSNTPILISKLIKDSDSSFVFEKTGDIFKNVMIDEFQDTSQLQWNNFKMLLLENQSKGGYNLLVGDIKQSIYRWRNGDWRLLYNAKNELAALSPIEKYLNRNFRSKEHIVTFNNDFFKSAAQVLDQQTEDPGISYSSIYNDVEQECHHAGQNGYVKVKLFKSKSQDTVFYESQTCDEIISEIENLHENGVPYSDMAILIRNNRQIAKLVQYFAAKGSKIPIISDEAFRLDSSVALQMLIAALHVLVDDLKNNQVYLNNLIILYAKYVQGQKTDYEHDLLQKTHADLPLDFWENRHELKALPLYMLCERIVQLFELNQIPGHEPYLYTFFDELQEYLKSNTSDIVSFLEVWDSSICAKSIPVGEIPGIRVMSIHKSKGLQFDTVFLPFLDWKIDPDDTPYKVSNDLASIMWLKASKKEFNTLGSMPLYLTSALRNSYYKDSYQKEHRQKKLDALNLLYVAFTRAESNLLIYGQTSGSSERLTVAGDLIYNSMGLEAEEDSFTFEKGTPVYTKYGHNRQENDNRLKFSHQEQGAVDMKMVTSEPIVNFQQSNQSRLFIKELSESGSEPTASNLDFIELGKLLHYILSLIKTPEDIDKVVDVCRSEGITYDEEVLSKQISLLKQRLALPEIKPWFSGEGTCYNECSISFWDQEHNIPKVLRPDRVIVSTSKVQVVDFKFVKPRDEHIVQVKNYLQLMQKMYPKHQIEGWLWYVIPHKIVAVNI